MIDVFKAIVLGIIEGITEWLPISSTGHLIIFDRFLKMGTSAEFNEMFNVVIQLGAIMAVVVLFWGKLFPFTCRKSQNCIAVKNVYIKKDIIKLWCKVIIAVIPSGIVGVLFDDKIDELLFNPTTVAIALIVYGIGFIIVEKLNKNRVPKIPSTAVLDYKTAFIIGLFQVLALVPGTSRSGTTILGAILIGVSRTASAEFSFYLAIPTMFGASLLKLVKFGFAFTGIEFIILATGMITAFVVSVIFIKWLMDYIKKNSFSLFGYYRIILGIAVLVLSFSGVIN